MKLPRSESGVGLIKKLSLLGYYQTRQIGSHIRVTRKFKSQDQHVTIPNHDPIRVGTLSNILKVVASHLETSKEEIIKKLYS
jgi:predicted RNA binding protein YcfA (HicA-like mRNA interferase family)